MTEPAPALTVVIPALNERRLERLLPELRDELAGHAHGFDVLDLRYGGFCEMILRARRRV